MNDRLADLGMIGLGVMGRNLLLNLADHGFAVAGYDRDPAKVRALADEGAEHRVIAAADVGSFLAGLKQPRTIMLLVPAGDPVDAVIAELRPQLAPGDLLIDGGNSHFEATDRRAGELSRQGLQFLGVGVSGGEEGARRGPSMMPGGSREAYERVRPLFEAIAAKVNDVPCVAWMGPGSAGHYVKMVHNGIEYGLMELIAESYDFMKRGLGLDNRRLQGIYQQWNRGALNSYLLEITAEIFGRIDDRSGRDRIDMILDAARQKGTGMWTAQDAMSLQVPVPVIDMAVAMRDLSGDKALREQLARDLGSVPADRPEDPEMWIVTLEQALYAAVLLTYTQGLALLHKASLEHNYALELAEVAKIWRGGCIIRAALLDDLREIFRQHPSLAHPLLNRNLAEMVRHREQDLRLVVGYAIQQRIPVPGLAGALAYFDAYRSAWLPANLIQAQRDYFGAHTYERVDTSGTFHSDWTRELG